MGKVNGAFSGLMQKVNSVFYKCEYLKECSKVSKQCWEGGNSYCGEYKKRVNSS
jgi:hypothetical protein